MSIRSRFRPCCADKGNSNSTCESAANNLALALDFSAPNLLAPAYSVPTGPYTGVCTATPSAISANATAANPYDDEELEWGPVSQLGKQFGFPIKD